MEPDQGKLISRIQKLLNLSKSSNQHEAEQAATLAQRLMAKHSIKMAQLNKETWEFNSRILKKVARASATDKYVATILHRHFNVRMMYSRAGKKETWLVATGTEDNLDVAEYMYKYLNDSFDRCWKSYYNENSTTRNSKTSFQLGMYNGLNDKLKTQKEEMARESDCTALVVMDTKLDTYMKQKYSISTRRNTTVRAGDSAAKAAGFATGRSLSINKALS